MNSSDSEYVVIGKVGTTYGIKGWVKIISFTDPLLNILDYDPWFYEEGSQWKLAKVSDCKPYGKGIIAKLAGYDNPEKAKFLTGRTIAIKREQLPALKENDYYWADLEGLTVINQTGETLGKVINIIATGSNDVLVIKGEKEHAIPYLWNEVIKSIDLDQGTMQVDWEPL